MSGCGPNSNNMVCEVLYDSPLVYSRVYDLRRDTFDLPQSALDIIKKYAIDADVTIPGGAKVPYDGMSITTGQLMREVFTNCLTSMSDVDYSAIALFGVKDTVTKTLYIYSILSKSGEIFPTADSKKLVPCSELTLEPSQIGTDYCNGKLFSLYLDSRYRPFASLPTLAPTTKPTPSPTTMAPTTMAPATKGLGPGEIAGIVIGSLAGFALLVWIILAILMA